MRYISLLLLLVFLNCEEKNKKEVAQKIVFDVYEPSEMATLMNEMYDYNLAVKDSILNGHWPTHFPIDFIEIHKAEMTEGKSRNTVFNSFSEVFLKVQEDFHNTTDSTLIIQNFNKVVDVCISCHQTECVGPIPRIKKLRIQ
ncbi:hypothetical protein [Paucihalobacter sp.]|uniref:hypothetical protein n=1 Tax=Paucihalobacter sp. TaxID=2850405 RepID=UPI002FE0D1F7